MKKKYLFGLVLFTLFILTGCGNKTKTTAKKENKKEIKTTLSCYHETYLFHSKKSVEHIMYLNKNNKLINYKYIEKYFEFDETGGDFELICMGSPDEAKNNNKMYKYLNETAECDRDKQEVTISDYFDISKLNSKNQLRTQEIIDNLDDNYLLDIENYRAAIGKKGYTCEEK